MASHDLASVWQENDKENSKFLFCHAEKVPINNTIPNSYIAILLVASGVSGLSKLLSPGAHQYVGHRGEILERLGYPVPDIEIGLAYHLLCRSRSRCWNIVSKVGLCRRDKYLSIDV